MSYQNGPPKIVTDGLVLCLDPIISKSYPGSGNTVYDLSGRGNNGTLINNPQIWSDGRGSFHFNASNNTYISVPNSSSLNGQYNTLSCWAKSDTINWNETGFLMSKRNVFVMHPNINAKTVNYYYYLNNSWQSLVVSPSNIAIWNMYSCTWDGSYIRSYLNGLPIGSFARTGPLTTNDTGPIEIGRDDAIASRLFTGSLTNALMYDIALSDQQILQNYNATKYRFGL